MKEKTERPPRFVAYGPGFSGGYSTLTDAKESVRINGAGATYLITDTIAEILDTHDLALRLADAVLASVADDKGTKEPWILVREFKKAVALATALKQKIGEQP